MSNNITNQSNNTVPSYNDKHNNTNQNTNNKNQTINQNTPNGNINSNKYLYPQYPQNVQQNSPYTKLDIK